MSIKTRVTSAIVGAGVIGASLVGCGSHHQQYTYFCVNPYTQFRVIDLNCPASWYYYVPYGYRVPAVNVHVHNYNRTYLGTPPKGAQIKRVTIPASGGRITPPAKQRTGTGGTNYKPGTPKQYKPANQYKPAPRIQAPARPAPAR